MSCVAEVRIGTSWVVKIMDDSADQQSSYLNSLQHLLHEETTNIAIQSLESLSFTHSLRDEKILKDVNKVRRCLQDIGSVSGIVVAVLLVVVALHQLEPRS